MNDDTSANFSIFMVEIWKSSANFMCLVFSLYLSCKQSKIRDTVSLMWNVVFIFVFTVDWFRPSQHPAPERPKSQIPEMVWRIQANKN